MPIPLKAVPNLMTDGVKVGDLWQDNRAFVVEPTGIPE